MSSRPAPASSEGSERREATIVFCDLGGYTRWNEQEDPEEVALVMDLIRDASTRIFEAHGGIVNQFVGDEVMGVFGIVSSHDDDPCRALAAALALHAFLREDEALERGRRLALRMHSGAESGLVFARTHDLRGGLFELTGEVVNTAARLRSLASADELLCGPALQRHVQHYFQLEPLERVLLHGSSEEIVPYRVLAEASENTRFDVAALQGLTHYVNRESELETLLDLWRETEEGHGSVVSVVGPPGIGKTRFLHELRKRIGQDAHVLHGRCSAYRNVAPYQPFIDALRSLLELGPSDARETTARLAQLATRCELTPESQRALSQLLSPGERAYGAADAAEVRAAIVAALDELITALTRERSVLLILEDWHWADEASRNALRQIGQSIDSRSALIAINYRSTELTEQAQPKARLCLTLCALDPRHTESMASNVLGGRALPLGLSDFVHIRTLGNPFFVEEICRSLLESGTCRVKSDIVVLQEPLFQLRAPSTVQAIVRGRVDRLPFEQRSLLRLAAVIGQDFDVELLELLTETPDAMQRLHDLLHALETQDHLRRDPDKPAVYHFKHAITREVVYEGMPVHARRRQHARLAYALENQHPSETLEVHYEALANHYRLGGVRDKAQTYAVLAAQKAWRQFALEQAGVQYRRAFELLREVVASDVGAQSRLIDVSLGWARVGIYNPHPDQLEALQLSLELTQKLGDRRRTALCLDWLAWIEYGLGEHRAGVRHAEQFLEQAEALNEPRLIAQAHLNCGREYMVACEYERAQRSLELGRGLLARGNAAADSYALSNLAMISADRGQFERAHVHIEDSERVAREQLSLLGPLRVLRAIVESWQGLWTAALATSARAHELGQRIEGQYILGMSHLIGGYASYGGSGDAAALAATREGIEQLEHTGQRLHMSYNYSLLAKGLAHSGDYGQAEQAAERALARGAERDRQGAGDALQVLALVAGLRDRQLTRAQDRLARAVSLAREKGSERELAMCDLRLAEILHAHGQHSRAASLQASGRARADAIGLQLQHRAAHSGEPKQETLA